MKSVNCVLLLIGLSVGCTENLDAPTSRLSAERTVCDNGRAAYLPDGSPNWSCIIDGASPSDDLCWEDRLDECYQRERRNEGLCLADTEVCHGLWECFDMWLYCDGTYRCDVSGTVGCEKGTCTTGE